MEIFYDSFKIWVEIDDEAYIWVQPEREEGYWEYEAPNNVPDDFYEKVDKIWNILFS